MQKLATAEQIISSAALWKPNDALYSEILQQRHELAQAACRRQHSNATTTVLQHGGWCLSQALASRPASRRHSGGVVELRNKQSFALPRGHYAADGGVVAVLADLLLRSNQSIADLGAGVGEYGHALLSIDGRVDWRGYDGAGNVEAFTGGFVRFVDLTIPLSLPKADWVLSLEVGEHIPPEKEGMYLRNLHAHNCRGVIGSWGAPDQRGTGHVNLRPRSYVLSRFAELGYRQDTALLHKLEASPHVNWTWPQLRRNLFVVVRDRPNC